MITLMGYILLQWLFESDWSGWLLMMPVLFDLAVIQRIGKDD